MRIIDPFGGMCQAMRDKLGIGKDRTNDDLAELETCHQEGMNKFTWVTANDKFVCGNCRKRSKRKYSYKQIKEIIINHSLACKHSHCRCSFLGYF